MNRRGFTLVELLSVIVIIGIIALIAVPNVMSTINNTRKNDFLLDAKRLVTKAEYLISTNKSDRDIVLTGSSVTYSFEDLNEKNEFPKDPDGGKYDNNSQVIVSKNEDKYDYCIKLIGSKRQIVGTDNTCLNSEDLIGISVVKER